VKNILFFFFSIGLFATLSAQSGNLKNIENYDDTAHGECAVLIDSIVDFALKHKGATYKYGAAGPKYFDCSGLVYYTFNHFGIKLFRSSQEQYNNGIAVKREDIRKGDLVFFKRGEGIGHVGIVIENNDNGHFTFVHASTYKRGICIDNSAREGYANNYVGARRIIVCDSTMMSIPDTVNTKIDTVFTRSSGIIPTEKKEIINTNSQKKEKTITYVVKKGDTLYGIAKKHNVKVDDIKKWNNLRIDRINIGQKLKIKKK
jgi:LysM repeat protein